MEKGNHGSILEPGELPGKCSMGKPVAMSSNWLQSDDYASVRQYAVHLF